MFGALPGRERTWSEGHSTTPEAHVGHAAPERGVWLVTPLALQLASVVVVDSQ
jgi:hypothetical protein